MQLMQNIACYWDKMQFMAQWLALPGSVLVSLTIDLSIFQSLQLLQTLPGE
jgi:hypothetical protein